MTIRFWKGKKHRDKINEKVKVIVFDTLFHLDFDYFSVSNDLSHLYG